MINFRVEVILVQHDVGAFNNRLNIDLDIDMDFVLKQSRLTTNCRPVVIK